MYRRDSPVAPTQPTSFGERNIPETSAAADGGRSQASAPSAAGGRDSRREAGIVAFLHSPERDQSVGDDVLGDGTDLDSLHRGRAAGRSRPVLEQSAAGLSASADPTAFSACLKGAGSKKRGGGGVEYDREEFL